MTTLAEVFKDVTPIPQDDGPDPVCAIDYPNGFVEAMGYLRAMLKRDERSERSLELTATCLRYNPANYSTWWFRRKCLAALSSSPQQNVLDDTSKHTFFSTEFIETDLMFAARLGGSNPKNYQIWYHRRSLLEHLLVESEGDNNGDNVDDPMDVVKRELEYITSVLECDAKNYHAWSHRQWIIQTINKDCIWEDEVNFSEKLISQDVRNNSAWNQRWFSTHQAKLTATPFSLDNARKETKYAIKTASLDPYNESPWKYCVAMIKEQFRLIGSEDNFMVFLQECEDMVLSTKSDFEERTQSDGKECTHLLAAHIDILEMKGDTKSKEIAAEIAQELAIRYDPIRRKYWNLRKNQLQEKVQDNKKSSQRRDVNKITSRQA